MRKGKVAEDVISIKNGMVSDALKSFESVLFTFLFLVSVELPKGHPAVLTWNCILSNILVHRHLGSGITQLTLPEGLTWLFDLTDPHIFARECHLDRKSVV